MQSRWLSTIGFRICGSCKNRIALKYFTIFLFGVLTRDTLLTKSILQKKQKILEKIAKYTTLARCPNDI